MSDIENLGAEFYGRINNEKKSEYFVNLDSISSKNENFISCFNCLNDKYYLDLYDAARVVLKSLGVESISGGNRCTYNEPDHFFSYRRDGRKSGRMAHLIWIDSTKRDRFSSPL